MADEPSQQLDDSSDQSPAPEVLTPREEDSADNAEGEATKPKTKSKRRKQSLRSKYHLSHKATFIGLAVVVVILAINAFLITFVIRGQSDDDPSSVAGDQVTINQEALERLGVNRASVDDLGAELVVGPNARFEKEVEIAGNVSVGGELVLNDRLSASDASFSTLQAGDTSIEQLNVNGDGTLTNMNIRQDMTVAGTTRLQGPTTLDGLLTVENSVNVAGNLTVGGSLTVNNFHASTLRVDSTLTVGGHFITVGSPPSVSSGPAAGSNGTVSISGNDIAGTVGFNAGTGAGNGIVARVTFNQSFSSTPHVVVTPIGDVGDFHIFRNSDGFSIAVGNSVPPGGYAFDYHVLQ